MKIVINSCFGGFSLSAEGEALYAELKGFPLFRYEQTKYRHRDGEAEYTKVPLTGVDELWTHTVKRDLGERFSEWPEDVDEIYWSCRDIERTDPDLIRVVEELGEKASGRCASLKIVEIPDGVEWVIEEYDGNERISEVHQTWS